MKLWGIENPDSSQWSSENPILLFSISMKLQGIEHPVNIFSGLYTPSDEAPRIWKPGWNFLSVDESGYPPVTSYNSRHDLVTTIHNNVLTIFLITPSIRRIYNSRYDLVTTIHNTRARYIPLMKCPHNLLDCDGETITLEHIGMIAPIAKVSPHFSPMPLVPLIWQCLFAQPRQCRRICEGWLVLKCGKWQPSHNWHYLLN